MMATSTRLPSASAVTSTALPGAYLTAFSRRFKKIRLRWSGSASTARSSGSTSIVRSAICTVAGTSVRKRSKHAPARAGSARRSARDG